MVSQGSKNQAMNRSKALPAEVRPLAMLAEINQVLTVAQSPRAGSSARWRCSTTSTA